MINFLLLLHLEILINLFHLYSSGIGNILFPIFIPFFEYRHFNSLLVGFDDGDGHGRPICYTFFQFLFLFFFFGYRHFTSLLVGFDYGDGYYGRSQLVILTRKEIK